MGKPYGAGRATITNFVLCHHRNYSSHFQLTVARLQFSTRALIRLTMTDVLAAIVCVERKRF